MRRKRISLVLGSGGARGYAHIGVIEELEQQGYEIAAISGASMGALIGGLYACGKLNEYKEWVLGLDALDVMALLDFSWDRRGVVKGEKVLDKLRELLGNTFIEDLPIEFTAVASELRRNREIWFQKGDLLDAIRASISIPTFFTPVERDGMLLVDGGVLNPLPVAPTMAVQSDMTIAVSLYGDAAPPQINISNEARLKESRLDELAADIFTKAREWIGEQDDTKKNSYHLFDVIDMTLDSMQKTLIGYRMGGYPADLTIEIPQTVCGGLDFHKAHKVIETGRIIARKSLGQFWENSQMEPGKPAFVKKKGKQ